MNITSYIDHTILKPEAQKAQVIQLCKEAREYNFASVCINPYYTSLVKQHLEGSGVKVCVVVGFPLGATFTEIKVAEAKMAIEHGAQEIDMVINIGALKDGDDELVKNDIEAVVKMAGDKAIVKVIIETCLLTKEEKARACTLAISVGAHFVKTSTGFSLGGATKEDVILMKQTVGEKAKVKASGGVKDFKIAMEMIEVGAERIGTSSGVSIKKNAPMF